VKLLEVTTIASFSFQAGSHVIPFHITLPYSPNHKYMKSFTLDKLVDNAQVIICSHLLTLIFVLYSALISTTEVVVQTLQSHMILTLVNT